jgi:hypothetical protein
MIVALEQRRVRTSRVAGFPKYSKETYLQELTDFIYFITWKANCGRDVR